MKDMYGKEVSNGDFLVEGDNYGEVALFFKVMDNKPVLVARWAIGVLDKYNVGKIREHQKMLREQMKVDKSIPEFYVNYWSNVADRLDNVKLENLMLVKDINAEILNKFVDEGHEAIDYTSQFGEDDSAFDPFAKPIAFFPDKTIMGEY